MTVVPAARNCSRGLVLEGIVSLCSVDVTILQKILQNVFSEKGMKTFREIVQKLDDQLISCCRISIR